MSPSYDTQTGYERMVLRLRPETVDQLRAWYARDFPNHRMTHFASWMRAKIEAWVEEEAQS